MPDIRQYEDLEEALIDLSGGRSWQQDRSKKQEKRGGLGNRSLAEKREFDEIRTALRHLGNRLRRATTSERETKELADLLAKELTLVKKENGKLKKLCRSMLSRLAPRKRFDTERRSRTQTASEVKRKARKASTSSAAAAPAASLCRHYEYRQRNAGTSQSQVSKSARREKNKSYANYLGRKECAPQPVINLVGEQRPRAMNQLNEERLRLLQQFVWKKNQFAHCVGRRVGVWRKDVQRYIYGTVLRHSQVTGECEVSYDAGNQTEWLDFSQEMLDWSCWAQTSGVQNEMPPRGDHCDTSAQRKGLQRSVHQSNGNTWVVLENFPGRGGDLVMAIKAQTQQEQEE